MGVLTLLFLQPLFLYALVLGQDLPTVYEYYTEGGITKGLEALPQGFQLNGKDITIQSGAIHYFRIHPQYWRDRLRKLRATGLIAVETYVPWNLHEPEEGFYDFGEGGRDYSSFLDVRTFLKTAQEEDLLVLFRPGPYICAEWEMGGLPSWLHNIPGIKMRSTEVEYTARVTQYYKQLLPYVNDLMFTNGGPIIAVQIENEYSSVGYLTGPEKQHLLDLKGLVKGLDVNELLFTSDNNLLLNISIPDVLKTVNFQDDPSTHLNNLKRFQPGLPAMVMEFWTGWYDRWFMDSSGRNDFTPQEYAEVLEYIMKFPASFNLYMFIGGTNWGFLNGGNAAVSRITSQFDTTSYDYGAPLTEAGDYTEKYNITRQLVNIYQPVKLKLPQPPVVTKAVAYEPAIVHSYLSLNQTFTQAAPSIISPNLLSMEELPINNGTGQTRGYIWYRATGLNISAGDILQIIGHVHDAVEVFVDGQLQSLVLTEPSNIQGFGYWKEKDAKLELRVKGSTLDLIVENLGRINFGIFTYSDRKGLYDGPVLINGEPITSWEIKPLDFGTAWVNSLNELEWNSEVPEPGVVAPGLYRGTLEIPEGSEPRDTYLETGHWFKGVALVNGFNLGRYNKLGPQRTLYIPAPILRSGSNVIIMFEQFIPAEAITFTDQPNLG